jgi:hypothetical protein
MNPQEKYNQVCEQVRCLEKSINFIYNYNTKIECEDKLKKVNKLLDDEYRYGSSYYDLKCLFKYLDELSQVLM